MDRSDEALWEMEEEILELDMLNGIIVARLGEISPPLSKIDRTASVVQARVLFSKGWVCGQKNNR